MSKKALVTGSAGFVGRHMVRELRDRGWEVFGWDIKQGNDALDLFGGRTMPITAYPDHFDLIVHCAYHVGGRAAIDDSSNLNFAKNLELDAAMFQWAVRTGQGRVLYFSSSAVYPVYLQSKRNIGEQAQLFEDDVDLYSPEPPDANYGWAKLTGERLARDARAAGLKVTVVRPFSGASGQQSLDYPFPSIIGRARNGDLSVWGNPQQVRDWIDVSDVVNGALAVVESETTDPINLCTGRGVSMADLAVMAFSITNPGKSVPEVISTPGAQGVFYRVGNPDKFHQYYIPKITLEEMVQDALS